MNILKTLEVLVLQGDYLARGEFDDLGWFALLLAVCCRAFTGFDTSGGGLGSRV